MSGYEVYALYAAVAVSAVAAVSQAQAAKKSSDFNEEVNRQNAELARRNAAAEAIQQDRLTKQRLGVIRANQGKGGGDAGEGSVLDVLGDVASQSELERQNILYRGATGARGFSNSATLDSMAGDAAQTSGYLQAGSSLLGGYADATKYQANLKRA